MPKNDFKAHFFRIKGWFFRKDYPVKMVNDHIDKVVFSKTSRIKKSSEKRIPFKVTYRPKIKDLITLIKDFLPFLYSNEEVGKIFSPSPIVSNRSSRKRKNYIVRSKLYPVERKCRLSRMCGF